MSIHMFFYEVLFLPRKSNRDIWINVHRSRLSMVQDGGARGASHWSAGGATGSARVSAGGARCPMVDSPGCARGARHWSAGGATGRARGSPGAAHSLANGGDVGSRAEHPAGRWSLRLSAERATARGAKRLKYVTFFGAVKNYPCSEAHHRPPGTFESKSRTFILLHLCTLGHKERTNPLRVPGPAASSIRRSTT